MWGEGRKEGKTITVKRKVSLFIAFQKIEELCWELIEALKLISHPCSQVGGDISFHHWYKSILSWLWTFFIRFISIYQKPTAASAAFDLFGQSIIYQQSIFHVTIFFMSKIIWEIFSAINRAHQPNYSCCVCGNVLCR